MKSADPFLPYRQRARRNFWTMSLGPLEAGDVLSPEKQARVYELFPEDAMTLAVIDARGQLALFAAIPEAQLPPFADGDWRVGHHIEGQQLILVLVVGQQEPLECPFEFDLLDSQDVQAAIQLWEREEVAFCGVTHFEEGLMLTIKGSVDLPAPFREELRVELVAALSELAGRAGGASDGDQSTA